jgi:hypothetical protein
MANEVTVEVAIADLAREAFPAIQGIWKEPWRVPPDPFAFSGLWNAVARVILACQAMRPAEIAVRKDSVIGPAIASQQGYVGGAMGSGGTIQAEVLPLNLLQGACMEVTALGHDLTNQALVEAALRNVVNLRSGIRGDSFDGWVLTAFSGLKLSPGVGISTPWGVLVHADRLSSEMWHDPMATCTAVLGTPVRTTLLAMGPKPGGSFFTDAYRIAQLVAYGVALGSNADDPTTAVPLRSGELLPWGMTGTGGELRIVGFGSRSTPLSADEASRAASWMNRLNVAQIGRIDVALRRLVRGLAERFDKADALIDGVIAWENLVEHRGRPTPSVLYGIGVLSRPSDWSKTRINKVYETRSSLVHGEQPDYNRINSMAPDALRIGLDAMRRLLDCHPDKLDMISEDRVLALGLRPNLG